MTLLREFVLSLFRQAYGCKSRNFHVHTSYENEMLGETCLLLLTVNFFDYAQHLKCNHESKKEFSAG